MSSQGWGRFFCRVLLGVLFFVAGFFKCFELGPMSHALTYFVEPYAESWIPEFLLIGIGVVVPIVELLAGLLLIVGWRIRDTLVTVGFLLLLVTYGHLLAQPIYDITSHILPRLALMVTVLLIPDAVDTFSADYWLSRRRFS